MRISIRQEDYSAKQYELLTKETSLAFIGEKDSFSLPYPSIVDFVITQDTRGMYYFTMLCDGKLYEGQITEPREIEPFALSLSKKLGGTISIEVKNPEKPYHNKSEKNTGGKMPCV